MTTLTWEAKVPTSTTTKNVPTSARSPPTPPSPSTICLPNTPRSGGHYSSVYVRVPNMKKNKRKLKICTEA